MFIRKLVMLNDFRSAYLIGAHSLLEIKVTYVAANMSLDNRTREGEATQMLVSVTKFSA